MKERIPLIIGIINYILFFFIFSEYLIFGIIIFITCLIFVWAYKTTVIEKILFTLIPLLYLFLPNTDLYEILAEKYRFYNSQKIDFIFPENFNGNAVIITEKECGQKVIVKDGFEKLYLPKNGILFYNGTIKDYGGNYYFRYYRINKNDTLEIPGKYLGSFINPIKSDSKVVYVDATINEDKNLSKILLNFYSTKNKLDDDTELLKKDYNCN
ncbi:hypothetical protein [Epilithonimonas xixisoli]|uniref:Uncharacterized protein n=1 Tax=Epilithonimonas xixisoli TaxID=1476462 RepID=A0A4R8ID92_9FLAO|nr:hypothetical protein [Epilithonimonas xixisoli]TDX82971.1 hypothetical protein B0I22_3024 [Epilithonimonas xixisoli]